MLHFHFEASNEERKKEREQKLLPMYVSGLLARKLPVNVCGLLRPRDCRLYVRLFFESTCHIARSCLIVTGLVPASSCKSAIAKVQPRESCCFLSVFFSNGHAGRGYPPLKWTSLEKNTSCSLRVGDKNERNSKEQEIRRKGPSPCYSFALRFLSWSAPRWCDFAHVECILVQQS